MHAILLMININILVLKMMSNKHPQYEIR